MREFFRGWKRKAGCVTLLLACVFTAGRIRSREDEDDFGLKVFSKRCDVNFAFGVIRLSVWNELQQSRVAAWTCREIGMASLDPDFHRLMNLTDLRRLDYELTRASRHCKATALSVSP